MNVFNELAEIEEMKDCQKNLTDDILDLYKKNPKECSRLLKELNDTLEELEELEKEFKNLQNEYS